jgi:predicted NBD/HSP70 family sugar kinase
MTKNIMPKVRMRTTRDLREFNEKNVLRILRSEGVMTKSQIARALDISFSTVSQICDKLEEEGLVRRTTGVLSSGGRPPASFSLNPYSRISLCIDLTGSSSVNVALVGLDGSIILRKMLPFLPGEGVQEILLDVLRLYPVLLQEVSISTDQVLGVGVAIPGIYDLHRKCVVNSTLPFLEGSPLKDIVAQMFDLPVLVENESNLAALASSMDGGRQKYQELLFLYMGIGLGLGIVHNGSIFRGARGFAGEIAHIPLGDPDYVCYCGNRACIEGLLSGIGGSRILESMREDYGRKKIGQAAGILVATLVNLFDPEIVFIGADWNFPLPDVLPHMRQEIKQRVILQQARNVRINVLSGDVHELFIRGASEIVIQHWLTYP